MDKIGHYHILDRIGAGGMGEVYRARDTRLGRTVAIKVLPDAVAHDPERRDRFLREARASAALSHPNICALFEIGEEADRVYLVFEYVKGETLRQAIDGRPLNVRTAIDAAVQLADALADAHAAGIVHRDIKPENIIVTPKGLPKILDFGLAAFTEGGAARENAVTEADTGEGVALGTVAYMSPEQALGEGFDHRTDIFSLGVVLYEMLTGKSPFKAATSTATALQVVQATPPPPSAINRNVAPELDAIVMRALMKDPRQRYQSAATLSAELRSVGAILDVREAVEFEVPDDARRARWRLGALVVVGAAALIAAAWFVRAPVARLAARWFGAAPPPVLAVIPLDVIGGDQSKVYFADGLTEDLITRIGQLPGVKVLGRSATRDYRGRSVNEIAAELHAAVILTGTVQSDANQVKVTIELDDPDGTERWSKNYQRSLTNIFAVQTDIAEDVARGLSLTLTPSPARARTAARQVNAAAYDLYLRGREAAARREVDRAIALYRQALQADPALAEASAGLAEALHRRGVFEGQLSPELDEEMRRAAVDAAATDPDLPQAQLALGLTEPALADALKRMRRAIEIDPSYSEAYHLIGDQILEIDPERAIAFYRRSLELDPRAIVAHADIALIEANRDRPAEASAELAKTRGEAGEGMRAIAALVARRPREAVAIFDGPAKGFRDAGRQAGMPSMISPLVLYVSALRQAGETAKALDEAEALGGRARGQCEPDAILAALRFESGQRAAAHALADAHVAAAAAPNASRADMRCGPMAAAAIGDADAAGAMLSRIASDESYLRYWVLEITGTTGRMWIERAWFPFDRIAGATPVKTGRDAIAKALKRERDVAAEILAGVLDREPSGGA